MWDVPMTWSRKFQLAAFVSAMLQSSPALAQEFQVACKFEPSTMDVTDPDAKPWHDDVSFRFRTFVMKLEPPEMVEGPAPQIFWGVPSIHVDVQEVRLEWQIKATARERLPTIILIINRFSGEAEEGFTMLAKAKPGASLRVLVATWALRDQREENVIEPSR
jgi:hypothetical protein